MINGIRYDFSSVIIAINGIKFGGVKSLNYSGTLTPGKLRGNRAQVIGRTRGSYDATGSLEVWKAEWRNMLEALGPGFMEQAFGITAAYSELTTPQLAQLDEIVGCRIVKHEDQMSEGEEPLTVKLDLDIMYVVPNGLVPVSPLQFFK
jgi:hypothetical protein